ncbi:PerC family transcriptional regulator [Hafnia sp.]|uniref:PerC family transcriptional regulator n=1 Tax=Hafnia sp. TaxID=1873498 RepID=UPI002FC7063C
MERAQWLEDAGLWRRAARRWLDLLDKALDDDAREQIVRQRYYCLMMADTSVLEPASTRKRTAIWHLSDGGADRTRCPQGKGGQNDNSPTRAVISDICSGIE